MDDVLRLAGALGVDLQGVVQEKDLGKLDEVDEGDEDNPVDGVCDSGGTRAFASARDFL